MWMLHMQVLKLIFAIQIISFEFNVCKMLQIFKRQCTYLQRAKKPDAWH